MILVDTSVWVDHLRAGDEALVQLLYANRAVIHPFVIGEIALGHLPKRRQTLQVLNLMPQAPVASHVEVMHFIDQHRLFGYGIGYVDAHLLASVRLSAETALWTRDKRLLQVATRFGLAADLPQ